MDPSQLRGFTFLMSLGGLLIACPQITGDTDSATGTGTGGNTTTGTTDTTGTTGTTGTTQQPTDGGMTASESGTTTGDPTTGDSGATTTTGVTGTTTGTTDPGTGTTAPETTTGQPTDVPVCDDFGDKFAGCFPQYARYADEYVLYCNDLFALGGGDGQACLEALEEFFVCVNGVDCQAFEMELSEPVVCAEAQQTTAQACPNLGG